MDADQYCRELESYLCRKNDGHLIRIVGPAFERVSVWARQGIPLRVAFEGVDRYFERYYRNGPRRRPVRIEFCEADILDTYDAWRRALGITRDALPEGEVDDVDDGFQHLSPSRRHSSLQRHLDRVLERLTALRSRGGAGPELDTTVDRIVRELDAARLTANKLRGAARAAFIQQLASIDRDLIDVARRGYDEDALAKLRTEARSELEPFRARMPAEAYERSLVASTERLIRKQLGLPQIAFE